MSRLRTYQAPQESDSAVGEGGYLTSSSDLMVGVLFIFLILVTALALQKQAQERETAKAIKANADPRGFITEYIGKAIKSVSADTTVDPKTGVISFPEKTLFSLGSARLLEQGQVDLRQIQRQLETNLPCFVHSELQKVTDKCSDINPYGNTIETIFIEGHTDSIPFAVGTGDNYRLSLDRARAVEATLVQDSSLNEMQNEAGQRIFSFSAYADSRPRSGVDPADPSNRRVDLRVVLTYRPINEILPGLISSR